MSDDVASRLKNIEALVLSLKEDRAGQQSGSDGLPETLYPLVCEHVADLKHYLALMLDAVSKNEHADEGFEIQIGLISSQIENGFRNLAQNIASIVGNTEVEDRRNSTQQEFEEQVELLKRNNAEFISAITRLVAYEDAQNLLEKEAIEREVESISQTYEIERLKVALEIAQSQKGPAGSAGGAESAESAEGAEAAEAAEEYWKVREAELVSKHKTEIRSFTAKYRALFEEFAVVKGNIRVISRIRQENAPSEELIKFEDPEQDFLWTKLRTTFSNDSKKLESRDFEFQRVFGSGETNQEIFLEVKDFAESAASGRTCTVMGYGATGTGKSHTFLRKEDGLVQSYIKLLFELAQDESSIYEYEFHNKKAEVRLNAESTTKLDSREAAITILEQVVERREVASTKQNAVSSRSHFILSLKVSKRSLTNSNEKPIEGQVRFLDLAGSERVGKNSLSGGSSAQQSLVFEQGNDINKGLLDLGKGIRSLATRDRRPAQGKLVTQAKAPESSPPRNSRPAVTGGGRKRNPSVSSAISSKVSTPTRNSGGQGNTKP
ncbi:P-loop containing nucleoside triphosphate hydrolase protein [Xylaria longipes]|nr:P-loop containing nucleoside triphosphate hydrolase protein [Xylaria longipes]